ncbi:3-hydroxyacyl-CoA dehydrogenase NAD-binding domain-containing protein, partial [Saccharophagus degradans]
MEKTIAIIGGCGHVGLPLGMVFATKGFRVHLVDISEKAVATVNAGTMP